MKSSTLFIILGLIALSAACSSAPQQYRMANCKPAGNVDGQEQYDCEQPSLPSHVKAVK